MHARVTVGAGPTGIERSEILRSRAAGPLRLLHPRAAGRAAWIVTSSLGGGLVDGDHVSLEVTIEPGGTGLVTTQSSTKVYRGTSGQRLVVVVGDAATAVIVPDPVVPYRDARFTQATTIGLAGTASLIYADTLTAGRVAFGERWAMARLDSSLTIERAGEPVVIDRLVLDRTHGDVAARMRRFEAIATVVLLGLRLADLAQAALAALRNLPGVAIAGSPLAEGVLIRIAGERVELVNQVVRASLQAACARVGEDPWSRKW
ncbi:MAG: urease accessory protein UreD [Kofleriaceae bacterium]